MHEPVIEAMLDAYRKGHFPMADPDRPGSPLLWFNPPYRGVIPLDPAHGLHIPRRLRDRARSGRFRVTTDESFVEVMRGCAGPRPGEPETWIDDRIVSLYTALHHAGYAHSVEAWLDGAGGPTLVGGLYGVHIGAAFFAESKFSRPEEGGTDASKVCLYHLIAHMRRRGFALLDVQVWNPHLDQFGCTQIPRARYLTRLKEAVERPLGWLPFQPAPDL